MTINNLHFSFFVGSRNTTLHIRSEETGQLFVSRYFTFYDCASFTRYDVSEFALYIRTYYKCSQEQYIIIVICNK